ncbi:hypothetical protein [Serratia proteamaculans]|uniref:hypothetical protein n=1 Tax=Serratia proteamaculans TaxID=28151 RepID=UPI00143247DC|nr:hypothetical protein [Serratia proteamaculans]
MRLLTKIRALQRRSEISQRHCEAQLLQLARKDEELCSDKDALSAKKEGLCALLETQRLNDAVLNREQLHMALRKQAILRHQLHNLELQSTQLDEQRKELAESRILRQGERCVWLRKDDKYQRWAARVRKQDQLLYLREDEAEQEERTSWNQ